MNWVSNPPVRRGALVGTLVTLSILAWCWFSWSAEPQLGADKEVINAVDALFTAVSSRDANRLAACERRLHDFKDAGLLPSKASAHLDAMIAAARSGQWKPAAAKLYRFMQAQRRVEERE